MSPGRPAVAVGCGVDGVRTAVDAPWRVTVEHGEVALHCRWTAGPTALRGAVVAALAERGYEHADLHGHLDDGTTRQARATVLYRVGPSVFAYGPRAALHLHQIARVSVLRLTTGDAVPVESADLSVALTEVGLLKDGWRTYDLVTPYFPTLVANARRPGRPGIERRAWAGQAIASSIRAWLGDLGVGVSPQRPVHVQIDDGRDERVQWRGREARWGFVARFTTNAILPAGVGLGQHAAEGFGEVRPAGGGGC